VIILCLAACDGGLVRESTSDNLSISTTAAPLASDPTSVVQKTETPQPSDTPTRFVPHVTIFPALTPTPILEAVGTVATPIMFPEAENYTWNLVFAGLRAPVGIFHAGDGSGRLFILEQGGVIRIFKEGKLLDTPFLDIRDRVSDGSEQGLLGLAFHPQYDQNGYFFINCTDSNGDTVIARYRVSDDDPNLVDLSSEVRILFIPQPYANHNGGMIAFGPDGYLYAGLGDGGAAGDPQNNGQSLVSLLGTILRIDIDGGSPYSIPPDNPFQAGQGRGEIWAFGLRNPWRFSFDRLTGDLYIGDVGQNQWEEIDYIPAGGPSGLNFGWSYFEGNHPFRGTAGTGASFIPPIAEYDHNQGCSVTGGVVYRGPELPEWQGVYLFGDYCSGRVWALIKDGQGGWREKILYENLGRISSFGGDEWGNIYLVEHSGKIYVLGEK